MNDLATKPIPKPTSLPEWLHYIEALHPNAIAMGLERVEAVANRLNLTQSCPIISIAGTNGKGSTCAMLESIYLKAGYVVGAYNSPHFLHYNERIRINQQTISDEALCAAFSAIEAARDDVVLTYFEMGTLAAMWYFAQSAVDVVLLEVGMGGRLDAVNVFEPACSIVTSIALDHMEYLGDTREKIGFEKAGIYRTNKPAICGDEKPPQSVIDYAESIDADFNLINHDFKISKEVDGWHYVAGSTQLVLYQLGLQGDFQLNNAACAITAVEKLNDQLPVPLEFIVPALEKIRLVGRFYQLSEDPLIIVDVAHNPQAAESLAQNLQKNVCKGQTIAVFAMLADKDVAHVVDALTAHIDFWCLADTQNPRGATANALKMYLQPQAEKGLTKCFKNVANALRSACIDCGKNDRIIVFGSFYTVADALQVVNT